MLANKNSHILAYFWPSIRPSILGTSHYPHVRVAAPASFLNEVVFVHNATTKVVRHCVGVWLGVVRGVSRVTNKEVSPRHTHQHERYRTESKRTSSNSEFSRRRSDYYYSGLQGIWKASISTRHVITSRQSTQSRSLQMRPRRPKPVQSADFVTDHPSKVVTVVSMRRK